MTLVHSNTNGARYSALIEPLSKLDSCAISDPLTSLAFMASRSACARSLVLGVSRAVQSRFSSALPTVNLRSDIFAPPQWMLPVRATLSSLLMRAVLTLRDGARFLRWELALAKSKASSLTAPAATVVHEPFISLKSGYGLRRVTDELCARGFQAAHQFRGRRSCYAMRTLVGAGLGIALAPRQITPAPEGPLALRASEPLSNHRCVVG